MSEDTNHGIRKRSGEIESSDKLVVFLYLLMRDELSTGAVAELVNLTQPGMNSGISSHDEKTLFCNGWLAKYAEDLAARLR